MSWIHTSPRYLASLSMLGLMAMNLPVQADDLAFKKTVKECLARNGVPGYFLINDSHINSVINSPKLDTLGIGSEIQNYKDSASEEAKTPTIYRADGTIFKMLGEQSAPVENPTEVQRAISSQFKDCLKKANGPQAG